jgi:hypothetical protein
MSVRHVVRLAPSVSFRLLHLPCRKRNEQSRFHSPYTLPSSVSRKSFACHSYENTRGVGVFFPFWNSSGSLTPSTLRLSDILKSKQCFDLSPFHSSSCALFCTQENPNSFPFNRFRTLCEKPPGVGGYSTSSTFGRSDFRRFRRVPHFPKSAIFSIP